jgi:TP901 family phage tail tape measure protein
MGTLGVSGAAKSIVGTMKSFTSENLTAAGVADKLARITQLTNFQMTDFEIGLSKAAAVAGTFNTSLDDTLVALGLLRNRNIDASSAATAFREAQRRVASDRRAQSALEKVGVKLTDERTGKMRSAISILLDFAKATSKLETVERNRLVTQAFGARGLLAFSAIADATATKTTALGDVTVKGAEAIDLLRAQVSKADGTVKTFAEARMGTFEGQIVLISGLLDTLKNRLGKTFAGVFKPVVEVAAKAIEYLTSAWTALPDPVQKAIAGLFLAASAFLTGGGAIGLLVAAFVLLLPVIKIVVVALGVLAAAFLPVIAGVGAAVLAFYALKRAWDLNMGGIQDKAREVFRTLNLGWNALSDLFSSGKISDAVSSELDRAENVGVKRFVMRAMEIYQNLKAFVAGVGKGISKGFEDMRPTIDALSAAFNRLKTALGLLADTSGPTVARMAKGMDEYGAAGESTGSKIAKVAEWIVQGITFAIDAVTALAQAWDVLAFVLSPIAGAVLGVIDALAGFTTLVGGAGDGASSTASRLNTLKMVFVVLGSIAAAVIGGMISTFTILVEVASGVVGVLVNLFKGLWDAIMMIGVAINAVASGDWGRAWTAMKGIAFSVIRGIMRMSASLFGMLAGIVDAFGKAAGKDWGLKAGVAKTLAGMEGRVESAMFGGTGKLTGGAAFVDTRGFTAQRAIDVEAARQRETEAREPGGMVREMSAFEAQLRRSQNMRPAVTTGLETQGASTGQAIASEVGPAVRDAMNEAITKIEGKPIQTRTTLELDGEVLYDKLAEIARGRGATGFEPG